MEMTENNFVTMLEESIKPLHTGETVTGIVYAITDNEIYLDLGAKFTGVIVKEQITDDASAKLQDMFKVGDEVTAFVIRVEDGKGMATLSKTRVDRDRSWVVLKEAFDKGENLEGEVTAVVKGGVVMTVAGNRVFVPASQTGIAKDGDMSTLGSKNTLVARQKSVDDGSICLCATHQEAYLGLGVPRSLAYEVAGLGSIGIIAVAGGEL
jgi:4-hydroxy-3-methylbut-2-enyl diphosphate reductase